MRVLFATLLAGQFLLFPVVARAAGPISGRRAVTEDNCKSTGAPDQKRCLSRRVTGFVDDGGKITPFATSGVSGYGPSDLVSAYNLTGGSGAGKTVALVEAFHYPNAEADMEVYRQQFGLPAAPSFKEISSSGGSVSGIAADAGWEGEEMLDIDMVSAICPTCNILIVAAPDDQGNGLFDAANAAAAAGATAVSNSWGGGEGTTFEANYDHPGVLYTASAGDSGFGASYPATSAFVLAVGGTTLNQGGGTRGWTETVWNGTGSGCSALIAQPSFQSAIPAGCSTRMEADVSAIADPNTGVAVYDSGGGGWGVFGGTSAASPIVAATFARYGIDTLGNSTPYSHTSAFYDVTSGSNDLGDGSCTVPFECNAQAGYDGPTGWGTPNGAVIATISGSSSSSSSSGSSSGSSSSSGGSSSSSGSSGSSSGGSSSGSSGSSSSSGGSGSSGASSGGGSTGSSSGVSASGSSSGSGGSSSGVGSSGGSSSGVSSSGGSSGLNSSGSSSGSGGSGGGNGATSPPTFGSGGSSAGCVCAAPGSSLPDESALGIVLGAFAVLGARRRRAPGSMK